MAFFSATLTGTTAWGQPPALATPREVVDETGRHVRVPAEVRRIVSLAPSLTETLYDLGAQDRLVGVTSYCDFPPEARAKPQVGGPVNPNLEQVVALKPDLVLVTRALNRHETVQALERLGLAVYATDPRTVAAVLDSTRRLGELIGAREPAEALAAALAARLERLKQRLEGRAARRVLFVVWHEPLITIGRDTFLADALRCAGAASVADTRQDWPRLSLEEVVRQQPDFLVFAGAHAPATEATVAGLRDRPGWRSLQAVQQGRVAVISDAVIRPAPRLLDAIEQLARQLHPDAFADETENRKGKMEKRGLSNGVERSIFSSPSTRGLPSFLSSVFHFLSSKETRCSV